MFSRTNALYVLFSILLSITLVRVDAAPVRIAEKRQLIQQPVAAGNPTLKCGLEKISFLADLAGAKLAADVLTSELASDPQGLQAIQIISSGINTAQTVVANITIAALTGQQPPANAQQQIVQGLTLAIETIPDITSPNVQVTQDLAILQQQLSGATASGLGIAANCGFNFNVPIPAASNPPTSATPPSPSALASPISSSSTSEASPTPAATSSPDATPTPDATSTPDASSTPDATSTPNATSTPDAISTTDATSTPEATSAPQATPTPEATPASSSDASPTSDASSTQDATQTPDATSSYPASPSS